MIKKVKAIVTKVDVNKLSMQDLYYYYLLLMELGLVFKEEDIKENEEREELEIDDYME